MAEERSGPVFHAVLVAVRPDGMALYLGNDVDPRRRAYRHVNLREAAKFRNPEMAEMHLEVFCEPDARVVNLFAVSGQEGGWRGWHGTGSGISRRLHGPDGGWVSPDDHESRPWKAFLPDGTVLVDVRGDPRRFSKAIGARRVLEEALRDFVPEEGVRPDPSFQFGAP